MYGDREVYGKISVPLSQFCYKSKAALKKLSLMKEKRKYYIIDTRFPALKKIFQKYNKGLLILL